MPRAPIVVLVLAALAGSACVPVVTHGPRVAPGLTVGAVGALSTRPVLEREVPTGQGHVTEVLAPLSVFARYGWTPESGGGGIPLSVGVSVPAALQFGLVHPELDVYAQLTPVEQRRVAAGAGALVSPSYVTPYAQAGYGWDDGVSVFTTQSVAFFRGDEEGRRPDAKIWMPSVAVKGFGVHLFAQAGLGRERITATSTRAVRFVMAGVVVEFRDRFGRY